MSTSGNKRANNDYIEELKTYASYYGYSPEDIDELVKSGFSPDEIEEYLYCGGEI